MTCPNKNLESWKELVNEVGEGKALAAFSLNNYEIPSLDVAKKLLNLKSPLLNIWFGSNENSYLSNLYDRPFVDGGIEYKSVEQYFQYQKWNYLLDNITENNFKYNSGIADKIMATNNGYELKKLGRMFRSLDVSRWEKNSYGEMKKAILLSFQQNPEEANKLISTGSSVFTHTQDKGRWGTDFPKILTEVRTILKNNKSNNQSYYSLGSDSQLPNEDLNKKITAFLEKVGVSVKLLDSIKDAAGNPLDVTAKADMLNKIIEIVDSKADLSTLPEEAAHFFVELLGPNNPLYEEMLNSITSYDVYRTTVQDYKGLPAYKNPDGSINFLKIKKEAIGKLIASHIIRLEKGEETQSNLNKAMKWWHKVWDYVKKIFGGVENPFQESAQRILNNDTRDLSDDYLNDEEYYQTAPSLDKLLQDQNRITLDSSIDQRTGQKRHIYYIDGKQAKGSVTTTKVDAYYKEIFPSDRRSDLQKELDLLKAEYGDVIHADIQEIFRTYVDPETGLRRAEKLTPQNIQTNQNIYDILERHMLELINSYTDGTKFFTEVKVHDSQENIAGSIDLLIVQPDGTSDIFDWKSQEIGFNQDDIKTFKEPAYRLQLGEYKRILEKYYGFKKFGKIRAIPIKTEFKYTGSLLEGNLNLDYLSNIEIGNLSPENIPFEKNYLLPIILSDEPTGDPHLDKLIERLNAVLKIVEKKKVKADQKHIQKDEILKYRNAIRDLQIRKDVRKFNSLVTHEITVHNKKIKDGSLTATEAVESLRIVEIFSQASGYMEDYFINLVKEAKESGDADYQKLVDEVKADFTKTTSNADILIKRLEREIARLATLAGEKKGITNLMNAEKSVGLGSVQGLFASISTLPQKAIKTFYKMLRDGQNERDVKFTQTTEKLLGLKKNLEEWGKTKGLSGTDLFNGILQIDEKDKWNGNFINRYDRDFYQKRDLAIKSNDITWLQENTVFLEEKFEESRKKMLEYYLSAKYSEDETENAKKQAINYNYWVSNNSIYDANGKVNPYAYLNPKNQFLKPTKVWETEKWKYLQENQPLKDVYDYFQSIIRESEQLGMLDEYSPHFIPSIFKSKLDQVAFGDLNGFFSGNGLFENLQVEGDNYFPEVDPLDGKLINRIPVYFTHDLGIDTEDGPDYSKKSRDLFKVFSIWTAHMHQYEALSKIEDDSLLLVEAEKLKGSIVANKFSKVKRKSDGTPETAETNTENTALLETFVNFYLYNRRKGSDKDLKLKIFGREYSGVKGLRAALNYFTLKTLALNPISGTSQFVGGTGNALLLGSKKLFFSNSDWVNAMYKVAKLEPKTKELIGFFNPLLEDQKHKLANELSLSGLVKYGNTDSLYIIQRNADKAVQYPVAIAMTMTHMVEDGKVVNILDHVKAKYNYNTTFYDLPESERKELYKKIETEAEELRSTRSIYNTAELKDGKLTVPGLKESDKATLDFRSKIKKVNKTIIGNSTQDDINSLRTTLLGQAVMNFRSWMPQMFQERFQGLKKDEDLEKYQIGKTRLFFTELFTSFGTISKSFVQGFGSDGAINRAKERYLEEKLKAYDEGREFEITEGEFIDMYIGNMRSQLREMMVIMAFLATAISISSLGSDDEPKGVKKYLERAFNKYLQEFSFYYSPQQFTSFIGNPFPILGLLKDVQSFGESLIKEGYGNIIGDQDTIDAAHPMKYFFRIFPVTKEAVTMGAVFDDDFRKDWGIKVN